MTAAAAAPATAPATNAPLRDVPSSSAPDAGSSSIDDPYAQLKELTRGQRVGQEQLVAFVDGLDISDAAKDRLKALTPGTYVGLAPELTDLAP